MTDVAQLKQVKMFEAVDDGMLELVLSFSERRNFSTGEILFRADEVAEEFLNLLSGRAALTVPISVFMVERELQIEDKGPGDLLGWSALVPPHKYTLTATGTEPGEILAVGRDALLRFCEEHPSAGYTIMGNVASIIGGRLAQVKALLLKEVERSIRLV
jgi:CRP-like cAMP-binding protein